MTKQIGRRGFITLLGGAAASWPLVARAQQADRVRRVGVLSAGGGIQEAAFFPAFRETLAQLGWTEGRNLQLELRTTSADINRARAYARELVAMKPDAIVATNSQMVQLVQESTRTIPIVFVNVPYTVVGELVGSVSRPTGNATGFINFDSSMAGKWLELLRETVPALSRIGVLLHAGNPTAPGYLRAIEAAASTLSIKLSSENVSRTSDIERIIVKFSGEHGSGLVVPPSSMAAVNQGAIVAQTAKHRLPAIYPYPEFVTIGGLMSYGFDRIDSYRKAAEYVDRILRGARPSDLPVQAPTKFQLVVNLKTAKALGLAISESFLLRADEVIE